MFFGTLARMSLAKCAANSQRILQTASFAALCIMMVYIFSIDRGVSRNYPLHSTKREQSRSKYGG
jgi:hypothetical protein